MGAQDLNFRHPAAADAALLVDAVGAQALAVTFAGELVAAEADEAFTVRCGAHRYAAQRAHSCLVEPEVGDRVACWRVADGQGGEAVFIVAVLTRAAGAQGLKLALGEGVELGARAGTLSLKADALDVQVGAASFVYRSMQSIGELCSATLGQLKLVGAALSTVFDRESHHAQQSHRVVDGLDRVDAKVMQHHASELMHLQAANVLTNGERLVKFKGAQIHLG
jgi:hypothetical protein